MPGDQALELVYEAKLSIATGALRPYNAELVRLVLLETRQLHTQLAPLADAARSQSADGQSRADPALAARLVSLHLQVYRNKRCLLVYHHQRLTWLRHRVWDKAGALALVLDQDQPASAGSDSERLSIRPLLSHAELDWLRNYTGLIGLYKDTYMDVLDIALPLANGVGNARHDGQIQSTRSASSKTNSLGNGAQFAPGAAVSVYAASTPPNTIRAPDDLMITVLVTRDAQDVETERGTMQLRAGEQLYVRRDEVQALLIRGWLKQVES
ncbi:DNA replication protein psf1 [Malassezia yamatoensis]|uniref:DNA replication complex GINS protein PSF1 n=1 Tax=Malassezia yamatoensis TaxID=253288 RepID=A0AAJ5YY05_9BASI|nr:DNA replication protein psf1 [Malassezia yamatoensis]